MTTLFARALGERTFDPVMDAWAPGAPKHRPPNHQDERCRPHQAHRAMLEVLGSAVKTTNSLSLTRERGVSGSGATTPIERA